MTSSSDPQRLAWVRSLPCYVCGATPCEAHHRTGGGMAMKSPDCDTIPLCARHHREFHDANGHFKGWTRQQRRDWQDEAVVVTASNYILNDPEVF